MMQITEEVKLQDGWYAEAKQVTMDNLTQFINHLLKDYEHNYGTICHALAAGALAAIHAMDNSPQGGITGFQAGAIMWEFIRHWNYESNKTSLKIVDYDNLLYPQYAHKFDGSIDPSVWESVKMQAYENLHKANDYTHPNVLKHWQNIVDGKVPFGLKIKEEN